jgi:Ca2+-binding RTX toxin-like protein
MNRTPHLTRPLAGLLAAGALAAAGLAGASPANAAFDGGVVANDTLTITGDNGGDVLALRLKSTDASILVLDPGDDNAGTNPEFDRATFTSIVVNGGGGKDEIRVDDDNGVFTDTEATTLNGGGGQDLLIGGAAGETYNGGDDADGISGRGGNDTMRGDAGDDRLRGGAGSDPQDGGLGADEFLWIPGDGNDVIEGGADADSLDFDGSNGAEIFAVENGPTAGSIHFTRNLGNIIQDTTGVERVRLQALGGDDQATSAANLNPAIAVEMNGGDGVDTLTGGPGKELIVGGRDNDVQRGGGGDDTIVWNPGDANDLVDGQGGNDVHDFNGAAGAEKISVKPDPATPGHVELLRDVANIDQDIVDTEKIGVDALGSGDELTAANGLGNLTQVDYDAGDGNDTVQTGDDADLIAGGPGNDILRAGAGDDSVDGQDGDDQLFGEAGLDRLTGGIGADSFDCGTPGDVLVDAGPGDTIAANCVAPANNAGGGAGPLQPTVDPNTALPAGFRGFARPAIRAGGVNTLSVKLRNTHSAAIQLRVQVTEGGVRYRTVTKRLAAGKSTTVKLRVAKKLRSKLAKTLKSKGKVTRRPTIVVTNVDTGGKTTVKPKLAVKLPRR